MSDILDLDRINKLGPLVAVLFGGSEWPLSVIDAQTGLMQIDVCGKTENKRIVDVKMFRDMAGNEYGPDSFYRESEAL
jgi:hypothetical protein